jgi:hypothetical protein
MEGVSFAKGPKGYETKALGMGIALRGSSAGQPGVGLSTGYFERWLKGALEVESLPLCDLCEGNLEGGLPCWGHLRIYRKGSGDWHPFPYGPRTRNLEEGLSTGDFESRMKGSLGIEHLSLKRLRGGDVGRTSFTGDPGRYVREVSECGNLSPWGPFPS